MVFYIRLNLQEQVLLGKRFGNFDVLCVEGAQVFGGTVQSWNTRFLVKFCRIYERQTTSVFS